MEGIRRRAGRVLRGEKEVTERFNAIGAAGRDCPICDRVGSLTGSRDIGGILECRGTAKAPGCFARFRFEGGGDDTRAHTLARIREDRPPVNARCRCGAYTGGGQCDSCNRGEQREQQAAGR